AGGQPALDRAPPAQGSRSEPAASAPVVSPPSAPPALPRQAEPASPTAPRAPAVPSPPPKLDDLRRRWPELARAALLQGQAVLAAALTSTSVVALDDGLLTIEVAPGRTPPPPDMDAQLQPYLASISAAGLRLAIV